MGAQHTPGPWTDGDIWPDLETGDWHGAISSPDQFIASTLQSGLRGKDEALANLRVFAAAPELLEVAQQALFWLEGPARQKAVDAIAKATGGQHD